MTKTASKLLRNSKQVVRSSTIGGRVRQVSDADNHEQVVERVSADGLEQVAQRQSELRFGALKGTGWTAILAAAFIVLVSES
jgi:hypothetical protein